MIRSFQHTQTNTRYNMSYLHTTHMLDVLSEKIYNIAHINPCITVWGGVERMNIEYCSSHIRHIYYHNFTHDIFEKYDGTHIAIEREMVCQLDNDSYAYIYHVSNTWTGDQVSYLYLCDNIKQLLSDAMWATSWPNFVKYQTILKYKKK